MERVTAMIQFACPSCGERVKAQDPDAGELRKCPKCKFEMLVPDAPERSSTPNRIEWARLESAVAAGVFRAHIRLFILFVILGIVLYAAISAMR